MAIGWRQCDHNKRDRCCPAHRVGSALALVACFYFVRDRSKDQSAASGALRRPDLLSITNFLACLVVLLACLVVPRNLETETRSGIVQKSKYKLQTTKKCR